MIAAALGPGSAVLIAGVLVMVRAGLKACTTRGPKRAALLSFPAGPSRVVFEQHAAGGQIVANLVGGAEIAPAPGRVTRFDQPLDLLDRHRRTRILRTAEAQHPQHTIELIERRPDRRHIAGANLLRVDRG